MYGGYRIENIDEGNYDTFLLKKRSSEQRTRHSPTQNNSHGNAVGIYSARNPRKAVSEFIEKETASTPFSMPSFVKSQMKVRKIVTAPVAQSIDSNAPSFATPLDARR